MDFSTTLTTRSFCHTSMTISPSMFWWFSSLEVHLHTYHAYMCASVFHTITCIYMNMPRDPASIAHVSLKSLVVFVQQMKLTHADVTMNTEIVKLEPCPALPCPAVQWNLFSGVPYTVMILMRGHHVCGVSTKWFTENVSLASSKIAVTKYIN